MNCERPKDHDEANLCEARRQAQAAEDAVWWTRAGFFAVAASLIFTGWAAFAATRAAIAAESIVKITSHSSQTELRAYLFVKTWLVSIERSTAGPIRKFKLTAEIENSGSTPPRQLVVCLNSQTFPHELPPTFDYPDINPPMRLLVGPRSIVTSAPIELHVVDAENIASGTKHSYCWGWIEYNDVFENTPRHRTEFCMKIQVETVDGTEFRIAFPTYGPFNGADADCFHPALRAGLPVV